MNIEKLDLENYRNYEKLNLEFSKGKNLFYGDNSSGKTNIIEAIYFCSYGRSFRCSENSYLVNNNKNSFVIKLCVVDDNNIINEYEIFFDKLTSKKNIKENGKIIKKKINIFKKIPVVLFSPENIQMVKSEPILRRKFIDDILINIYPEFDTLQKKFNRIIISRNKILKDIRENLVELKELKIWNELLIDISIKIIEYRKNIIKDINKIINNNISKEKINVKLEYNLKKFKEIETENLKEYFECFFKNNVKEEIARAITLIGPHRDDIDIFLNGKLLKFFGSEGQQRLVSIILKLAEGFLIKEKNSVYPIVLLDDFTSELDDINKVFISEIFSNFGQIFITTTKRENMGDIKLDKYFHVDNGKVYFKI